MRPKRIAFVGAGGITRAHKEAFGLHPERVVAAGVADVNEEAAGKLAGELGTQGQASWEAMLDGLAGRVDGVVVTTPHFMHAPIAEGALARGLPALVEKPVTCTVGEMRRLRGMERGGAFVQAGQQQRFGAEENWIGRWLGSEEFGEARLFNVDIYQNVEGYTGGREDFWILDGKKAGGGIVISVAVHILDLLRYWLADDFVEVYAKGRFDVPFRNGAESTVAATLTMGRGVVGTLNCSYTATRCPYSQRTLIFGTRGSLAQNLERVGGGYSGPYYVSTDGGKPSREWGLMYSGWQGVKERMLVEAGGREATETSAFVTQMLAFAEGIEKGAALENSLARNFNTIATIEAIGRAILSGKPERVEAV